MLVDVLAVNFLTGHSVNNGRDELLLYRLQRTLVYIKTDLTQDLSLAMLAALEKTSPAHFARVFKHLSAWRWRPMRPPISARDPSNAPARKTQDSNICSKNFTDAGGRQCYRSQQRTELILRTKPRGECHQP